MSNKEPNPFGDSGSVSILYLHWTYNLQHSDGIYQQFQTWKAVTYFFVNTQRLDTVVTL